MNSTFRRLRFFCRVLKRNKLWRLEGKGRAMRTCQGEYPTDEDFCPLTFAHYVATGDVLGVQHWHTAGRTFGFEHDESREIAAAADCTHGDEHQKKLRRILEKACGVEIISTAITPGTTKGKV